ncbi:Uncharacterised protein [Yersinia enterocolitica]|nr:Uncharacterised protein [Yersinia enterocolitica]
MGDSDHCAFVIMQEALQPSYGFGIQVVGRFIQQQHVWFFQQQAADSNAAALTTGQVGNFGIPRRQTQSISSTF